MKPWPYCSKGHDQRVVGLYTSGWCAECSRQYAKQWQRRRRAAEAGCPVELVHGDRQPLTGLAAARKALGLSQKQLAAQSGLSLPTISRLERDASRGIPRTRARLIDTIARLRREQRERERWERCAGLRPL